jgi:hypothetical protein
MIETREIRLPGPTRTLTLIGPGVVSLGGPGHGSAVGRRARGAVAVLAAVAVVVGQLLQRSADLLPVAAAAGVVAARLGTQQPPRPARWAAARSRRGTGGGRSVGRRRRSSR